MPGSRITLVVGLPGSGKSKAMRELAAQGVVIRPNDDDFLRGDLHPPEGLDGVIGRLKAGERCAVNDITLCYQSTRDHVVGRIRAAVAEVEIDWYYFDNDPLQCAANVILDWTSRRRGDLMARLEAIREIASFYRVPEGEKLHRVGGTFRERDAPRGH